MIHTDISDIVRTDDRYRNVGRTRFDGPCPACGGDDRCVVTVGGGSDGRDLWWCRQCRGGGDVVEYLVAGGTSRADAMREVGLDTSAPDSGSQAASSAAVRAATERQEWRNQERKRQRRHEAVIEYATEAELWIWKQHAWAAFEHPVEADMHEQMRRRIEEMCMNRKEADTDGTERRRTVLERIDSNLQRMAARQR
jgi:hypothetical protein